MIGAERSLMNLLVGEPICLWLLGGWPSMAGVASQVDGVVLPKFSPEPRFEPEPPRLNAKFSSSSGSGSSSRKFLENRFGLNRTSEPLDLFSLYFRHFFSAIVQFKHIIIHNYFSILMYFIKSSPGSLMAIGWLSCMCTCCGLLYNIYMAYQMLFVPQLCINT